MQHSRVFTATVMNNKTYKWHKDERTENKESMLYIVSILQRRYKNDTTILNWKFSAYLNHLLSRFSVSIFVPIIRYLKYLILFLLSAKKREQLFHDWHTKIRPLVKDREEWLFHHKSLNHIHITFCTKIGCAWTHD